jgi:prefoldin subunit 5
LKIGQGGGRPHDLLDAMDLLQRRLETLEQQVMRLNRLEDER